MIKNVWRSAMNRSRYGNTFFDVALAQWMGYESGESGLTGSGLYVANMK